MAVHGHADSERLKDTYEAYFETVFAETEEQRRAAYRLRYQVYCVEHTYLDAKQNPNFMETDACDKAALHTLLLHRATGQVAGTVRLILPGQDGKLVNFPIREVCHHDLVARDNPTLPWAKTAEISRFSIAPNFRRRANDDTLIGNISVTHDDPRRRIPNTSLGLMQAVVAMAAKGGVSHVCAVMDPILLRMLRRLGIHFIPIGPEVDYHGMRQPCYSDLNVLLTRIWVEKREIWEVVTSDGTLWPLDRDLAARLQKGFSLAAELPLG
jgi:N-acyl amino acid synthase of PEP-CTERM/exosortase system